MAKEEKTNQDLESEILKLKKQIHEYEVMINDLQSKFEIADQEEFKEINKSIMEVKDLKEDFDIKKNLENEINSIKETSTLVEKDLHDINKKKTQDEADLI